MPPDKILSQKLIGVITRGNIVDTDVARLAIPDKDTALFVVSQALKESFLFELLLSNVSETSYKTIADALCWQFPTAVFDYTDPPLPIRCFERLSSTLLSLEYCDELESRKVEGPLRISQRLSAALDGLSAMLPDQTMSSKGRRKSSVRGLATPSDDAPFTSINLKVPTTIKEATRLVQDLLAQQLEIFKMFLRMLRNADVEDQIRCLYSRHRDSSGSKQEISYPANAIVRHTSSSLRANLSYPRPTGFGDWRIVTADPLRAKIGQISQMDREFFNSVWQKMQDLSNGLFTPNNHRCITEKSPIDIFEAQLPGGACLVYQVDVVQESKNDSPVQALLIFGIFDRNERAKVSWEEVGKQQARRGKEYSDACQARTKIDKHIFSPTYFPSLDLDTHPENPLLANEPYPSRFTKAAVRDVHSLLVLGKHAILSQPYIEAVLQGADVAAVYQLSWVLLFFLHAYRFIGVPSRIEREVVHHPESLVVHGRSGTGKTTVAIFRLLGIERASAEMFDVYQIRPRQMFVSKSPLLVRKVENDYLQLAQVDALVKDAPHYLTERIKQTQVDSSSLFTSDDLGVWRTGLPRRFGELKDEHWPLFVTLNELWTMLENDLTDSAGSSSQEHRDTRQSLSSQYHDTEISRQISYDDFKAHYWPRLSSKLLSLLHSTFCIIFCIAILQGSEGSLEDGTSSLTRQSYENLRVQNIDYADFETYLRLKRERRERDSADRTHTLLRALKSKLFPGKKVDFLYLDEVQDFLLIDTILLRQMCRNTDGLFLAGDVAQTIAPGCSFRFEELTSFLYRYEKSTYAHHVVEPKPLKRFQLSINYRSPGGVVDCAHAVIELLQLFPRAVDPLDRERGMIEGLKPLVIHRCSEEDALKNFFLVDSNSGLPTVTLGANQCILVRDDMTRTRLKTVLGDVGVVLTLYQSKGLEFDDVILYNFFSDSVAEEALWRDLCLKARHRPAEGTIVSSMMFAQDDQYHAPLMQELKFLYVAITRTRRNFWLVDTSPRLVPMKDYFFERSLVELAEDNMSVSGFADRSASQDWAGTAVRLWKRGEFEEAASAFDRAGDGRRARMARARRLKEIADQTPPTPSRPYLDACKSAAAALILSALEATEHQGEQRGLFGAAAECFVKIGNHKRAADAFARAERWTQAAIHYFDAKMLDHAVRIVKIAKGRRDEVDSHVRTRIIDTAKYAYLESVRVDDASQLFDSVEEFINFMIFHDFPLARAELLKQHQEPKEAARLYFAEGQTSKALDLLADHVGDRDACRLAWDFGLAHLWACLSLGSYSAQKFADKCSELDSILCLLSRFNRNVLTELEQRTADAFKAIVSRNLPELENLAVTFDKSACSEEALLCLDHYFADFFTIDCSTQEALVRFVDLYLVYTRKLSAIVLDPITNVRFSRLLGLREIEFDDENVDINRSTMVGSSYRDIHGDKALLRRVRKDALPTVIRSCLSLYVQGKVTQEVQFVQARGHIFDAFKDGIPVVFTSISLRSLSSTSDTASPIQQALEDERMIKGGIDGLRPYVTDGSLLRVELVGAAEDGFSVVKQWVLDVIYDLNPRRKELQEAFLTNFLNAAKLGLRLERDGARVMERHLKSSPCLTWPSFQHPQLRNGELTRLTSFLLGQGDIADGVEFLCAVAKRRLPVDFAALCDFVDRLAGLFIMTGAHKVSGSLHDLVLPRSWIWELWSDYILFKGRNSSNPRRFVSVLEILLRDVYEEKISTAFLEHRVTDLTPEAARDACMSRISRAMCLVGLRFNIPDMRTGILQFFGGLWNNSATLPGFVPLFRPYLTADSWLRLEDAVQRSCQRSDVDEMVHLVSSQVSRTPAARPKPVRRILFAPMDHIPDLVRFRFGDNPLLRRGVAAHGTTSPLSTTALAIENAGSPDVSSGDGTDPADEAKAYAAAHHIQRAWRAHRPPNGALSIARYNLFRACRAQANLLCLPAALRPAFVMHLPRLILCVNWAATTAASIKANLVRKRKDADMEDVSAMLKRVEHIGRLERQARELQKALALDSDVYTRDDALAVLRQYARDLKKLVEDLRAPSAQRAIDGDLALAMRGFENTGRWKSKLESRPRPALNTDDL
ncbi:hypothetical protein K488DRAFT_87859 [Vararia minispora EC-137]|uniref:Uncharacterized protein n=1 Tax=Vararia minispora EC-137 TaxID=1314806 RepID=A0ACB8QF68_9AGAM|nr:hypothetical protein K488DRAFT_87859 [Vararia minispora EC-137]